MRLNSSARPKRSIDIVRAATAGRPGKNAGLGSLAYVNLKEFNFGIKRGGFNPKKPCCLCLISTSFGQRHLNQVSLEPLHLVVKVNATENVQRFESGCFLSESFVTCQRLSL